MTRAATHRRRAVPVSCRVAAADRDGPATSPPVGPAPRGAAGPSTSSGGTAFRARPRPAPRHRAFARLRSHPRPPVPSPPGAAGACARLSRRRASRGPGCAPRVRRRLDSTPQSPCDRSAVLERVAATPGWRSSCCDRRSGPRRPRRRTPRRSPMKSPITAALPALDCRVQRIGRALTIEEPAALLQRVAEREDVDRAVGRGDRDHVRFGFAEHAQTRNGSHACDHLARGIYRDLREAPVALDAEAVHHGPCGRHREPRAACLACSVTRRTRRASRRTRTFGSDGAPSCDAG